jgi:SAM-dependent methyltransferase
MTVPPLEARWLEVIDRVARRVLGPHDRTGTPLVTEIRHLSELYTRDRAAIRASAGARAARLRFFVPRDLPKIEGPLASLARRGLLPAKASWDVVDLGAGYGATTLGLGRLCKREGLAERLRVRAIDDDAGALDVLDALAKETRGGALAELSVPIELEATTGSVAIAEPSILVRGADRGGADLALAGFVVNELFPAQVGEKGRTEDDRLELLERWCARVAGALAPGGLFALLEPALREPSRSLQRLRDLLVARGLDVAHPCTHRAPCPLLARERDWCHAELPIALPDALVPVAREAGLRFEGLSYATLALRNAPPAAPAPLRAAIVGGPIATKGKVELQLCHEGRMTRLDWMTRDGEPPVALHRGARVSMDREPAAERVRHGRDVVIAPE